jgi:hypothetical protein
LSDLVELYKRCWDSPDWESTHVSKRPLRGLQGEIIKRVENFVQAHKGGVMTVLSSRQTGKNETAALLQRRHLWRNQLSLFKKSWIRTAPTHEPQIVNSKKRLEELLQLNKKNIIHHPLFNCDKLQKSEGYIWQLGNATVEFMSSGKHSNVVGATASECLDMDEAHKIDKAKFDEDFAPFTASTNAGTLLWGVAANGLDTIEWYRQSNIENKRPQLNLYYPCDVWADASEIYRAHLNSRVEALGWDHPIVKTQYRLIPVANEGTFINGIQAKNLFNSDHYREQSPRSGSTYEIVIDLAGGNEDFNPDKNFVGEGDTMTDSTVIWIYEVTPIICQNNIFPVIRIVNMYWWTGVPLPDQQAAIKDLVLFWRAQKITVDGIGIGRQIAESLIADFGTYMINMYIATNTTISEDCFDLLARLNYSAVMMFKNDGTPEWKEFERQVGWTKYSSSQGKMSLQKPFSDKHIDMVKALTYISRNNPSAAMHSIFSVAGDYT